MSVDKQIKKMVVKNLEDQIESVNNIAKDFEVKRVPLSFVNKIIDKSKIDVKFSTNKQTKALNVFYKRFNEMLESIKGMCKENSDIIGDEKMTPEHFSLLINHVKNAYLNA